MVAAVAGAVHRLVVDAVVGEEVEAVEEVAVAFVGLAAAAEAVVVVAEGEEVGVAAVVEVRLAAAR